MTKVQDLYMGKILLNQSRPVKDWSICIGCGAVLTSPQTVSRREGQRCHRKRKKAEGTFVPGRGQWKRTAGTGVTISDEPFVESGGTGYRRKKYK